MNTLYLDAILKNGLSSKTITLNVPLFVHPMLPEEYVDVRWIRPFAFRDFFHYIFPSKATILEDFPNYIDKINKFTAIHEIDRYKLALLEMVDEHIDNYGRLGFADLLMYVDYMAILCNETNLMETSDILCDYAYWVKDVVDKHKSDIKSSNRWGYGQFAGSKNETDLMLSL